MNARSFFFAAAGIFLVAGSYAIGSSRAQAQTAGSFVGIVAQTNPQAGYQLVALTSSGDWYFARIENGPSAWTWNYGGNVIGGTVATQPTTFGQAKRALSR